MENPYSLVFGKMPANYIDRELELNEIIETFSESEPSIRAYALTGLRGCGKTVALSFIEKYFHKQKEFIVISLNSELDMFEQTLEHLSQKKLIDELKISESLQKDNRISFLKRAEKKDLKQLSLNSIMLDYRNNLNISEKEAGEMALFTKGYSYAFQVLGYLCFRMKKNYKEVVEQFDEKMTNNVYDIIWEDLSQKEKEILQAVFKANELTTQEILRASGIDKNTYNEYRRILISKDILVDKGYGKIDFTLPRFKEIASRNIELGFW